MPNTFRRPYSGRVVVPDLGGLSPEVIAFALSRFSRSADDLVTSLKVVQGYADKRVSKFFEENYHGYGHASIADQAHVTFALENCSMFTIFWLWQMTELVDGQERSSRYQPFTETGFSTSNLCHPSLDEACERGFLAYQVIQEALEKSFETRYPDASFQVTGQWLSAAQLAEKLGVPASEITPGKLEDANHTQAQRIRRARAFDISRYLLPLATNTSAGFIMSARTLARIISELLVHRLPELYSIGDQLRCLFVSEDTAAAIPNLLKYAQPNEETQKRYRALREIVDRHFSTDQPLESVRARLMLPTQKPLLDMAARLIFPHHHMRWANALIILKDQGPKLWEEILDAGGWQRSPKEDFPRDSRGGEIIVELTMDIGAARDFNRHRGCYKIYQDLLPAMGSWSKGNIQELEAVGLKEYYDETCQSMFKGAQAFIADRGEGYDEQEYIYALPLATLIRGIYHMSWQQLIYMTELRSSSQGHFAYRQLAEQMVEGTADINPDLHRHLKDRIGSAFHFTPFDEGNFFKR